MVGDQGWALRIDVRARLIFQKQTREADSGSYGDGCESRGSLRQAIHGTKPLQSDVGAEPALLWYQHTTTTCNRNLMKPPHGDIHPGTSGVDGAASLRVQGYRPSTDQGEVRSDAAPQ
jgi:hypothetical protein